MPKTIVSKACRICKQITSEFYKNRTRPDGFGTDCKICTDKRIEEYHKTPKYKTYQKAYQKAYLQTEKGRELNRQKVRRHMQTEKGKATQKRHAQSEKRKKTIKAYALRHPNRIKARCFIKDTIRQGKLPSPNSLLCIFCKKPAHKYHHHLGYEPEHWLDVVPVCQKCHSICHSKYLSKAGNL